MLIRLSKVEKFIYLQIFSDNTDVQTNLGINTIKQESINFFSKRSDSKTFRLCRPRVRIE